MTLVQARDYLNGVDNGALKFLTTLPIVGETVSFVILFTNIGKANAIIADKLKNRNGNLNDSLGSVQHLQMRVIRDYNITASVRNCLNIAIIVTLVATGIILMNKVAISLIIVFSVAALLCSLSAMYAHQKSKANYLAV